MVADVEAVVDGAGRLASWRYDVCSQGHSCPPGIRGRARPARRRPRWPTRRRTRPRSTRRSRTAPAAPATRCPATTSPHRRVTGHRLTDVADPHVGACARSARYFNVFAIESMMDERPRWPAPTRWSSGSPTCPTSAAAGCCGWPRGAAGWGRARCPRAPASASGTRATRAPAPTARSSPRSRPRREVRVRRLWTAVDVGRVVNPDGVRNQIEGGAVQATSWTLLERVRFDRRRITSDDLGVVPDPARSRPCPRCDVQLVDRRRQPVGRGGRGRPGPDRGRDRATRCAAAVGVRVRDLPADPRSSGHRTIEGM